MVLVGLKFHLRLHLKFLMEFLSEDSIRCWSWNISVFFSAFILDSTEIFPECLLGFLQELLQIFLMEFFPSFLSELFPGFPMKLFNVFLFAEHHCRLRLFFKDFLRIVFRALPGIHIINCSKILGAAFGISLFVFPGVFAGYFPGVSLGMSPGISNEIHCKKFSEKYRKDSW